MPVHFINLDRDTARREAFEARNGHVAGLIREPGVDGRTANRGALRRLGLITESFAYSDGQLGCALSHIKLWRRAVREQRVVSVAEDDAVMARNFLAGRDAVLRQLPADWDMILWGWNFDHPVQAEIPEGVACATLHFDQAALRENISLFRHQTIVSAPVRLRHAFGTVCYSLSPSGARILLDTCVPLTGGPIAVSDEGASIRNIGIDCAANGAYPKMKVYISLPPLVVTENRRDTFSANP